MHFCLTNREKKIFSISRMLMFSSHLNTLEGAVFLLSPFLPLPQTQSSLLISCFHVILFALVITA